MSLNKKKKVYLSETSCFGYLFFKFVCDYVICKRWCQFGLFKLTLEGKECVCRFNAFKQTKLHTVWNKLHRRRTKCEWNLKSLVKIITKIQLIKKCCVFYSYGPSFSISVFYKSLVSFHLKWIFQGTPVKGLNTMLCCSNYNAYLSSWKLKSKIRIGIGDLRSPVVLKWMDC